MDPDATGPGAPTLDHLKPLAHGGTSAYHNLALAHKGCNTARGNAPIGMTQREQSRKRAAAVKAALEEQ